MTELRLIDSNGYTVPGTVTIASDGTVNEIRAHLLNEVAPADAAKWTALGFKADARDYRVQPAA